MEKEIFSKVLLEIAETQDNILKKIDGIPSKNMESDFLTMAVEKLYEQYEDFEKNAVIALKENLTQSANCSRAISAIKEHIIKVENDLQTLPKNVLHEKKTVLFPDISSAENFSTLIKGIAKWGIIVCIFYITASFIYKWITADYVLYKETLGRVYSTSSKKEQKKIDSIYYAIKNQ